MKSMASLAVFCAALGISPAVAGNIGSPVVFASGAALGTGTSAPDSIATGNGSVWVAYTNGANSTGKSGNSLVVQYNTAGTATHQYTIAGYVDGLKIDPSSGRVWALQNQDGNSAVTIIDPSTNVATSLTYATPSPTRGLDDIVFAGASTFLSETGPVNLSDPTIVRLQNGSSPLTFQSPAILTFGAAGTVQNDPDSLKLANNGDLILTSGDDGALNFISNPGMPGQTVRSISLSDLAGDPFAGLDDSLSPTGPQGTIYITDTKNNRVLSVFASGLDANALYAAVGNGTVNAVGQVDPITGLFTAVPTLTGLNAPHGLAFVASPEPSSMFLIAGGLALMSAMRRARRS